MPCCRRVVKQILYITINSSMFCNHLDGEERVACFAKFVFLVSCECCVVLPRGAMGFVCSL